MRYFIFNFETDHDFIESFLIAASKAHGYQSIKSKEWFYWKFRDNPFGESILACAEENGVITGCVGYGIQPFLLNGKTLKAVLSFETFVHPEFQGQGLFTKLIKFAENKLIEENICFVLNFPNPNSLNGFLKNGWKLMETPQYRIKLNNYIKLILKFRDFRKVYQPNPSNLNQLIPFKKFEQHNITNLKSVIDLDYLNWRFFTFPITEYTILNNHNYQSIIKFGKRGAILEAHILFINIKDRNSFVFKDFLRHCRTIFDFDIISITLSNGNPIKNMLARNIFLNVPSKVHMCYKILDNKSVTDIDIINISFDGINHHTN